MRSLDELPAARAILCDVTPRQLLRLAGPRLTEGFRGSLGRYRYGPGVCKLDWALDAPIPWTAPDCRRAGTVHLGGTLEEIAASERAPWEGECPARPFVLVTQPTLFDPTRAPPGKHIAWAYCHVPNGSTYNMAGRIEDQIDRFAPGFRIIILIRSVLLPADLEASNPNLVGGDITGGAAELSQLFTRPTWRVSTAPHPAVLTSVRRQLPRAGASTEFADTWPASPRSATYFKGHHGRGSSGRPGNGRRRRLSKTDMTERLGKLEKLFLDRLAEMRDAEWKLAKALPLVRKVAQSEDLKKVVAVYTADTKGHVERHRPRRGVPRAKAAEGEIGRDERAHQGGRGRDVAAPPFPAPGRQPHRRGAADRAFQDRQLRDALRLGARAGLRARIRSARLLPRAGKAGRRAAGRSRGARGPAPGTDPKDRKAPGDAEKKPAPSKKPRPGQNRTWHRPLPSATFFEFRVSALVRAGRASARSRESMLMGLIRCFGETRGAGPAQIGIHPKSADCDSRHMRAAGCAGSLIKLSQPSPSGSPRSEMSTSKSASSAYRSASLIVGAALTS